MQIVGLSCDYHDAAAALVVDGELVAAAEEERFTRAKHDASMPERSVASCLAIGGVAADDVDVVVFHEKPLLVATRVLAARQRRGPVAIGSFAREFPVLLRDNLLVEARVERLFRALGARRRPAVRFAEHHLSHAAAAFLPSPFDTAAILTIDGIGEWSTATVGQGIHHRIDILEELRYPHSLGLLYSLVTAWCGFAPNDGEYKLMGLAPLGEPSFADALGRLVEVGDDGSLAIDGRMVRWWGADPRRLRSLRRLFGGPPRPPDAPLTQREADLARSMQDLAELVVLRMARHARRLTGERTLCLGGGVALNCVANGRLLREGVFDDLWIQPAPGDAGSAVGAALWYWHQELGNERERPRAGAGEGGVADSMRAAALGPRFASAEIAEWLGSTGDVAAIAIPDLEERCRVVAEHLADGAVVGWFEGPMEFGPRALGHRSILADARSVTVHADLNSRVKGRESFRPFAPAVLAERAAEWFDIDKASPYMLATFDVTAARRVPVDVEPDDLLARVSVPRSQIPACTHVDGSARVQTVHREDSPAFHALLSAFERLTGCPVLLNTSFNRAGEPIVCTPADAWSSACEAGLDVLVLEDHVMLLREPTWRATPVAEGVGP